VYGLIPDDVGPIEISQRGIDDYGGGTNIVFLSSIPGYSAV